MYVVWQTHDPTQGVCADGAIIFRGGVRYSRGMDDLHLHVHLLGNAGEARFQAIEQRLTVVELGGAQMATKQEQLEAAMVRLDAVTNDIAAELTELRNKIADGSITDAAIAQLDTAIARLQALGADPADPVPEAPATTTP
jgi:hypothetical protein